ncbi:ornithine decarboxylase Spe1 [Schizosaccharomyces japonicus yFS275]|uniref:ornithine decarboxylase n=1 Tax=Schizosaccharomyces japonicus (strain yFS275 / FY16936) TaxID=402676 RepID=B6JUV0_SCHJY|nr:ornithine decarboxylase Spe1 [Schizosaccharomyces japonicus yFS275]EEB05051.1 ornithine decarboxylase Spe1 [Schizosaccharomyces japonicus yFS275]
MPLILEQNMNISESLRTTDLLNRLSPAESVSTWSSCGKSREAIRELLEQKISESEVNSATGEMRDADAFFVADLAEVYRQLVRWHTNLPRVQPFYAVKCNPDPRVLALLVKFGTGFDCASKGELQQILSLGVSPERIVYANPCKAINYIRYARNNNVDFMTFDNTEELYKCKQHHPNARLLLRISTNDENSICRLSLKFGAPMSETEELLRVAKTLDLNVVGVSFHVGSGNLDPASFIDAICRSRVVFDQGERYGFHFNTLDIGGGFMSDSFEQTAAILREQLDTHFPANVRIIAEPGRFFVATAFTLAVNVVAKRRIPEENKVMYYVNDGVYGSLNCILFDHQHPVARVLKHAGRMCYNQYVGTGDHVCSIWGPTCDSLDVIASDARLPFELEVGDWIYFDDAGAYTVAAASSFNGFQTSKVEYVSTDLV